MSDELALRADAERGSQRTAGAAPASAQPLRTLAARGAVWTVAGYGGGQALRFLGNLILTRLLFGEAFGLMALVNVFLQGLQLFSDDGIGPSILPHARGADRRFLDTAWTMQVVRGFVLFAPRSPLSRTMKSPTL
jgi:O-antigen/teichoic acid export membrane protein